MKAELFAVIEIVVDCKVEFRCVEPTSTYMSNVVYM